MLAHRVSVALTVGTGMLVLAFGLVVGLTLRPAGAGGRPTGARDATPTPDIEAIQRLRVER